LANSIVDMAIRVTLMNTIGNGLKNLTGDMKGVESGAQGAGSKTTGMSSAVKAATGIAIGAGVATVAFGSAIKWALDQAGSFQATMIKVGNATGATKKQMQEFEPVIMNIADKSIYTVDQVGTAVVELGQDGVKMADMLKTNVIQSMINLAEATGIDPVDAAHMLATALNEFSISAKNAGNVSDILAYALEHGIPTASKLQSALDALGGEAHSLGIPLSDSVAVLDTLGKTMGTTQNVGAAFRNMLIAISAPTTKQADELEHLGITYVNQNPKLASFLAQVSGINKQGAILVDNMRIHGISVGGLGTAYAMAVKTGIIPATESFQEWGESTKIVGDRMYDSQGKFIGVQNAVNILGDAYKKLDVAQRAIANRDLFGTRSATAAQVLADHTSLLTQNIKNLNNQHTLTGLAERQAALVTNSYNGQIQELSTSISNVGVKIGEQLQPIILQFLELLNNKVIPALIDWFTKNGKLAAEFLVFGFGISILTVIVALAALAFLGLDGAMSPIILIAMATIVAIVGLALAATWLYNNWGLVMKSGFGTWLKSVGEEFSRFGTEISRLIGPMGSSKDHMQQMSDIWKQVLPILENVLRGFGQVVELIIGIVMSQFAACITAVQLFAVGVKIAIGGVKTIIDNVGKFFAAFGQLMQDALHGNDAAMTKDFQNMWKAIEGIFGGAVTAVLGVVAAFVGAIIGYISGFVDMMLHLFTHLGDELVHHSIVPDMMKAIQKCIYDILANVIKDVQSFIGNALGLFESLPGKIMNALSNLGNLLKNSGGNMINMFGQGISGAIGGVISGVTGMASKIAGLLGHHSPAKEGPLSDDDTWMPNMIHMFTVGITNGQSSIKAATTGIASVMGPALQAGANSNVNASRGGGGIQTYNLQLDGRTLASYTMNNLTGQLQMNGASRMLL
jgi:minor tail protein